MALTEKQRKFLDAMFGDAKGNASEAKKMAGYSPATTTAEVMESLEDEIVERTKKLIASIGPKAAFAINDILDNPTALGNKDKLAAAKDFLDRAGFKPQEKVEIKSESPLFILPPKETDE